MAEGRTDGGGVCLFGRLGEGLPPTLGTLPQTGDLRLYTFEAWGIWTAPVANSVESLT